MVKQKNVYSDLHYDFQLAVVNIFVPKVLQ